jgi:hypothetical protein
MSIGPGQRCLFRFKETIDHNGVPLRGRSATGTSGGAIHHPGTAVHRQAFRIGENNVTAIGNPLRVDGDVAGPQTHAIEASAELTFAGPVHSNARED